MSEQDQRVAVITGGSQGIGAGLVAAYRQRGWAVVANARTIEPARDPDVLTVAGDVTDPATADRIIDGATERFGRVDTLINNAGVYLSKPFTDYTAADYALMVGVNLTGFFLLTQRAITEMLKRSSGHIVNITTTLADYANSSAPSVLTSLTKGGLASATKSLAIEYASRGIRVNAVAPGAIDTPMTAPMHAATELVDAELAHIPLHRFGSVGEVAPTVAFLCTEQSSYTSGAVFVVDGASDCV